MNGDNKMLIDVLTSIEEHLKKPVTDLSKPYWTDYEVAHVLGMKASTLIKSRTSYCQQYGIPLPKKAGKQHLYKKEEVLQAIERMSRIAKKA